MEGRNAQRDASRRTGSIVICVSDQASDAVASSLARRRADGDERAVVVTGLLTPAGDRQYVAPAHRLADHVDLTFAAATAEHGRFDEVHVVGPLHSAAVLVRRLRATGELHRRQVRPVAQLCATRCSAAGRCAGFGSRVAIKNRAVLLSGATIGCAAGPSPMVWDGGYGVMFWSAGGSP